MSWGCADCTTKTDCVFTGCKKQRYTLEELLDLWVADVDSEPFAPSDQSVCSECSMFGGGHFPWCSKARTAAVAHG